MKKIIALLSLCACIHVPGSAYVERKTIFLSGRRAHDKGEHPAAVESVAGVIEVTGMEQFQKFVKKSPVPVVLSLRVPGASYAGKLDSVMKELASKTQRVRFCTMSVMDNKWFLVQLATQLRMKEVDLPLILFFKGGQLTLPLISGFVKPDRLVQEINRHFSSLANVKQA